MASSALVLARSSHGSKDAGWRWRTRWVKSCARSIASATSADCAWSWASCWASTSVRCSARLRTSQVARRGVKGWETGSATIGRSRPALAAGWDALGLADAADIGRDATIASRVPVRLDLLKELDGGVAPGVPALQEIRLIGIEDTPPIVATVLRHGPCWHLQIPLDGPTAAAHLRGDGRRAPALAVQGPHRVIACLPASS